MTWSPLATLVTPGPTSTTMPAPSWPRMAGNSPSGSAPERVNSSVWQRPVALISTSASPARGPSRSTVSMTSGLPASWATAARTFIRAFSRLCWSGARLQGGDVRPVPGRRDDDLVDAEVGWARGDVADQVADILRLHHARPVLGADRN